MSKSGSKDFVKNNIDVSKHIPEYLKNPLNTALSRNLFNKFLTSEETITTNGVVSDSAYDNPYPQSDTERSVNGLVPMVYASSFGGQENVVYSFSDLIRKAKAQGLDVANFDSIIACQTLNFAPPINIDRFINYTCYYWIGELYDTQNNPSWNNKMEPEYYVIAKPKLSSSVKDAAKVATNNFVNLNGAGNPNFGGVWNITFTDSTHFTVAGSLCGVVGSGTVGNTFTTPFLTFKIISGAQSFVAGDTFTLTVVDFSSTFSYSFSGAGNGTITNIQGAQVFQTIDGIVTFAGMRVLVKNQIDTATNGVYVVNQGAWTRAADCPSIGSFTISVTLGTQSGTYTVTNNSASKISSSVTYPEWAEYNFWVHRDDVESYGFSASEAIQATRPIIEYDFGLELANGFIDGVPSNTTNNYIQKKFKKNQLPQFNLYQQNGTFAEQVSPIFYYAESQDAEIDAVIGRRLVVDSNNDFVFSQRGCISKSGGYLCFKNNGTLSTIWTAGASSVTVSSFMLNGSVLVTPFLTVAPIYSKIHQSEWKIVTNSDLSVTVSCSTGEYPTITQTVAGEDITIKDQRGVTLFRVNIPAGHLMNGDVIKFKIKNKSFMKFVDASGVEVLPNDEQDNGVWTTPEQLLKNPAHENRELIGMGDLITHFSSIISNQIGMSGSPFGYNNFRNLPVIDKSFGGTIKEHNGAFNLLLSMLNQDDFSFNSIIRYAKERNAENTSSINEYLVKELGTILAEVGIPLFSASGDATGKISKIVDAFIANISARTGKQYVSGSTATIPSWTPSICELGLKVPTQPGITFDAEIGQYIIQHHDGHVSHIINVSNNVEKELVTYDFVKNLANISVTRSDGTITAGTISANAPTRPYKNQLWFNPNGNCLYGFNVISDVDTSYAPTATNVGDFWYKRTSNILMRWSGSSWVQVGNVNAAWVQVSVDSIFNYVMLDIENRIFNNIPDHIKSGETVFDYSGYVDDANMEQFLLEYAAKNGVLPYASVYQQDDPFTWNYIGATIPGTGTTNQGPWYQVYREYFSKYFGNDGCATSRPDVEPWKLFGYTSKPANFETLYASQTRQNGSGSFLSDADVCCTAPPGSFNTAPSSVDSVPLQLGYRVLVPNSGVYVVSFVGDGTNGVWLKSPETISTGMNIAVNFGAQYHKTVWVYSSTTFSQVRQWTLGMWQQILTNHPSLKLGVNPYNERILPPYFPAGRFESSYALWNVVPPFPEQNYSYGQHSPVELSWRKSREFQYETFQSFCQVQPMLALEKCFGYDVWNSQGIDYQGIFGKKLNQTQFYFHGEGNSTNTDFRTRIMPPPPPSITSSVNVTLTCISSSLNNIIFNITENKLFIGNTENFSSNFGIDYSALKVLRDDGSCFAQGDTISFVLNIDGSASSVKVTQTASLILNGFGQWMTQMMKYNSVSLTDSKVSTLFREYDIRLGYRFGGYVASDTLKLNTKNFDIPVSACHLLSKVSPKVKDAWVHALRIQCVMVGSTSLNPNTQVYEPAAPGTFDQSFWNSYDGTTPAYVNPGDDWIFRVDGYFNQYPYLEYYPFVSRKQIVTNVPVVTHNPDGSVTIENVEQTIWVDGDNKTFYALDQKSSKVAWKQFTTVGALQKVSTPFYVQGIQNVVNILFGYAKRLAELGWFLDQTSSDNVDTKTGKFKSWHLEVEKFIDVCYNNFSAGSAFIANPFMEKIWFNAPQGLVSQFKNGIFGDSSESQFAYDLLGKQIPVESLTIIRNENKTEISSRTPMFGLHLAVDEYEHAIVFPNYLDNANKTKLIFDPFLGVKVAAIEIKSQRQSVNSLRPSLGGYFLKRTSTLDANGNDIISHEMKRNPVALIDDLSKVYDAEKTFDNPEFAENALALFGFQNNSYMDDIGVSSRDQFNYWRGMIEGKGANASVDALMNHSLYGGAELDEYWAFKIAEYGDARNKSFPELKLQASVDSLSETLRFQFYDGSGTVPPKFENFTQIASTDSTRWLNLADLNELVERGMYFDAVSVGAHIIKEFPTITNFRNTSVSQTRVPKISNIGVTQYLTASTYTVTMIDAISFTVRNAANVVVGSGVIDVAFSAGGVSFTLSDPFELCQAGDVYAFDISLNISSIVTLPFIPSYSTVFVDGSWYDANTLNNTNFRFLSENVVQVFKANVQIIVEGFGPQKPKFSPAKLFNFKSDALIGTIPMWHPRLGQHNPYAQQHVDIENRVDPAKYNQTTKTANNPNFDEYKAWGKDQVGTVWWNTDLEYLPYDDAKVFPNIEARLSKWGKLSDFSELVVCEWVESTVPPSDYATKVKSDSTDSALSPDKKYSGEVYGKKLIKRSRQWLSRPVAWKNNENTGSSPFFTSATFNKIKVTNTSPIGNTTVILNTGKFSDYSISTGSYISGWDFINEIPMGLLKLTGTIGYVIGSTTNYFSSITPQFVDGGVAYSTSVDFSKKKASIGSALGFITFTTQTINGVVNLVATQDSDKSLSQSVAIQDFSFNGSNTLEIDFTSLGVKISIAASTAATLTATALVAHLFSSTNNFNVFVRQTQTAQVLIGLPDSEFDNDTLDSTENAAQYGWRAWNEPSQSDLDNDLKNPDNLWVPVYGAWTDIFGNSEGSYSSNITSDYLTVISDYQDNKLKMNDGSYVEKFSAVWGEFEEVEDSVIERRYDGITNYFDFSSSGISETTLSSSRTFVYVNGTLLSSDFYTITGVRVVISSSRIAIGDKVRVVYKKVTPSADVLAFDPDVADDVIFSTQYKYDYDFTKVPVRDDNGRISSYLYYFWVTGKTTNIKGKAISVYQVESMMENGPDMYLTFHNPLAATGALPVRFDSVSIFGTQDYVTQDDTFNVRFTRNFTLRDDSEDLNLKNVHSEWALLRPKQTKNIPVKLWDKLVDSACGVDELGNQLPYPYLADFDAQHGTFNQYGLGDGKVLAPKDIVLASIKHTILNTTVTRKVNGVKVQYFIENLDLTNLDSLFSSANVRTTLDFIWRTATPQQINELFFAVVHDALVYNPEFGDIFKTSRLSGRVKVNS